MIAERIKNLEATQIMLRRQLESDIKRFNRALVYKSSILIYRLSSFSVNRLIKSDVNEM